MRLRRRAHAVHPGSRRRERLLTRRQAAEIAGVHPTSIRRWEASGRLTRVEVQWGKRKVVRIRSEELEALLHPRPVPRPTKLPRRPRTRFNLLGPAILAAVIASCATGVAMGRMATTTVPPEVEPVVVSAEAAFPARVCVASWYHTGAVTATGEPFNPDALTAASRTLALHTRLLVTEVTSNRSVVVRVNDRGPYVDGRCLDLSRASFGLIAPPAAGLITVRIEPLPPGA